MRSLTILIIQRLVRRERESEAEERRDKERQRQRGEGLRERQREKRSLQRAVDDPPVNGLDLT
jgi:hypothetical protein